MIGLATALLGASAPPAVAPNYEHSTECLDVGARLQEGISRSSDEEIASLFYDLSEEEAVRLSNWTRIVFRETGSPDEWRLVPEAESSEVTKLFAGLSFTSLSLDQWRGADGVSKLLYKVFFSHEREGIIELDLISVEDRCEIGMFAIGLPKSRPDLARRLPEIGGFVAQELGDGVRMQ